LKSYGGLYLQQKTLNLSATVTLGLEHPHTLESWKNLIELYEAWGKPEKANEWREKLPHTEAVDE
jgi:hypothetical protein